MRAGFGLGRLHHVFSSAARRRVILSAIDAGFRHFDLAPAYGDGLAERELGRALRGRRHGVRIATKYGIPFRAIGELPSPIYLGLRVAAKTLRTSLGASYDRRDFGPAALVASLENSLRRLRTDYVDYLLVHEPTSLEQFRTLGDAWAEMERQQRLGKIRTVAVSSDTRLLLQAEQEGLVPREAMRMIPMNDASCSLPLAWYSEREVFVFNVVKHVRRGHPGGQRIATRALIESFVSVLPAAAPVLASHDLDEIRRMGEVLASIPAETSARGADR